MFIKPKANNKFSKIPVQIPILFFTEIEKKKLEQLFKTFKQLKKFFKKNKIEGRKNES